MGCTYAKLQSFVDKNLSRYKTATRKKKSESHSKCRQISRPTIQADQHFTLHWLSKTAFAPQSQEKMVKANSAQCSSGLHAKERMQLLFESNPCFSSLSKFFYQAFQALTITVVIPIVQLIFLKNYQPAPPEHYGSSIYFWQISQILPTRLQLFKSPITLSCG